MPPWSPANRSPARQPVRALGRIRRNRGYFRATILASPTFAGCDAAVTNDAASSGIATLSGVATLSAQPATASSNRPATNPRMLPTWRAVSDTLMTLPPSPTRPGFATRARRRGQLDILPSAPSVRPVRGLAGGQRQRHAAADQPERRRHQPGRTHHQRHHQVVPHPGRQVPPMKLCVASIRS